MELPEVEVMRRDLEKDVVGRRIKAGRGQALQERDARHPPPPEAQGLHVASGGTEDHQGRTSRQVPRDALDSGDVLVTHFGMSGQFQRGTGRVAMPAHTHVVLTFQQGGDLRYIDPRTFGEMFVSTADEVGKIKELQHLAIDPLDQVFTWPTFQYLLAERAAKMKQLLMDQKFIAGLGNIYSDEVLFAAGIRFDRMSDTLVLAGGAAAVSRDPGDAAGRDQGARNDARGRGVRRPVRQAGGVRRASSRSTGGRVCRAGAAGRRSRASRSAGAARTSARSARAERSST